MFVYGCKIFSVYLILMILIFWIERFLLMMVFICCFVESSTTFGLIWRFSIYVRGLQWMDLHSVCYSQVDVSIISFSASLCIFGSRSWFGFCRGQWWCKDLFLRWFWTRRVTSFWLQLLAIREVGICTKWKGLLRCCMLGECSYCSHSFSGFLFCDWNARLGVSFSSLFCLLHLIGGTKVLLLIPDVRALRVPLLEGII